jgi:hypothetical protein
MSIDYYQEIVVAESTGDSFSVTTRQLAGVLEICDKMQSIDISTPELTLLGHRGPCVDWRHNFRSVMPPH